MPPVSLSISLCQGRTHLLFTASAVIAPRWILQHLLCETTVNLKVRCILLCNTQTLLSADPAPAVFALGKSVSTLPPRKDKYVTPPAQQHRSSSPGCVKPFPFGTAATKGQQSLHFPAVLWFLVTSVKSEQAAGPLDGCITQTVCMQERYCSPGKGRGLTSYSFCTRLH